MVACIFLTTVLPITISRLIGTFQQSIYARSEATPVVIGPDGSQLDLTLQTLYFNRSLQKTVPLAEQQNILKSDLAAAIPIHCLYQARGYPIIGTTLDYLRFRNLELAAGEPLGILGDCILGAEVAEKLKISAGDQLLSDRPNMLDLAGEYPLKMNVVGVLAKSGTPDDAAVFVDLKTAWVIQGLGHGHQDLESQEQNDNVVRADNSITAIPSKVVPYTEIKDANMASFHFHGDLSTFPVSAFIAVPKDEKSDTLLESRYRNNERQVQFVRPRDSIEDLMSVLFKVRQFFIANTFLIAISTTLLTALVVLLSLKLREEERATMFKLGCRSGTIIAVQAVELLLIFAIAAVAVAIAATFCSAVAQRYFESWISSGGQL